MDCTNTVTFHAVELEKKHISRKGLDLIYPWIPLASGSSPVSPEYSHGQPQDCDRTSAEPLEDKVHCEA